MHRNLKLRGKRGILLSFSLKLNNFFIFYIKSISKMMFTKFTYAHILNLETLTKEF